MQVAFQHVPKAAGTSLNRKLRQWLGEHGVLACERDHLMAVVQPDAFDAAVCLSGHLSTGVLSQSFSPSQIFVCLREPVDRVVSHYFYWREYFPKVPHKSNSRYLYTVDLSIDPWDDLLRCISSRELENYSELRNLQTWQLGHFSSVRDVKPSVALCRAKRWIGNVGCLGFSENYQEFEARVRDFLEVEYNVQRGDDELLNVNPSRPRGLSIPDYVREVIETENALDLELYHFARSVGAGRAPAKMTQLSVKPPAGDITGILNRSQAVRSVIDILEVADESAGLILRPKCDFLVFSILLQSTAAETGIICELRPRSGANLVAVAKATGLDLRLMCADVGNSRRVIDNTMSREALEKVIQQAAVNVEVYSSITDLKNIRLGSEGMTCDVFLVSRPYSQKQLVAELEFARRVLSKRGFVILEEAFSRAWPHATAGLLEYIAQNDALVPLCIHGETIILVSREYLATWHVKVWPFLKYLFPECEIESAEIAGFQIYLCL